MPEPSDTQMHARNHSSSLRRALSLLDYLAEEDLPARGTSLTHLVDGTGLNRTTVLRLLDALEDLRLVEQDPATRRWSLGPRTAYLGQAYLDRLDVRQTVRPIVETLAEQTGETVHVVTPDIPHVVYIDKIEAAGSVRLASRVGAQQPMHSSGVGKAVLALSPPQAVDRVIEAGLPRHTERTITDPNGLHAELAQIRGRGYAVDDVENKEHIRCVAAAVVDHTGLALAGLSVAGPTMRITNERVEGLARHVISAARAASARFGGA